jgi:glycosyltransferase involved in cell wall biosynthesis
MRILRVADVRDVRTEGMQRAMYGTGDVLQSRGHLVDYLFREMIPAPGPEKLRRFLVPLRVPRIVRARARQGREYDVVEIHEPTAAVYCAMRLAGVRLPPVVAYSHGLEERAHQAIQRYRRLKGLPVSLKNRVSPLSVVLQAKFAVRRADQVMCLNAEDIGQLRAAGVPEDRVTEVPNGIPKEFLETDGQVDHEAGGILFIGTWLMRKGIMDLAPAVATVLSQEPRVWLTVAGCGAPAEEVLADFPEAIRSRVTVLPKLSSNHELMACYRRHSVFVLPSVFEGYPLVLLEAAAMGLAPVTTDVAGGGQFVTDGENGLKVPVGDPDRLAEALLRLARSEPDRRRLGERARRKAHEFSWDRAASAVLTAYERGVRVGSRGVRARGTKGP